LQLKVENTPVIVSAATSSARLNPHFPFKLTYKTPGDFFLLPRIVALLSGSDDVYFDLLNDRRKFRIHLEERRLWYAGREVTAMTERMSYTG
jgi:hypothetical protein